MNENDQDLEYNNQENRILLTDSNNEKPLS
jgi:hypothetical protein